MHIKAVTALATACALFTGAAAASTPVHVYEFSGSGAARDATSPDMVLQGTPVFSGAGATQGLQYEANLGPNVLGALAAPGVYSIELFFSQDSFPSYSRLIDFSNGSSDIGFYLMGPNLRFYNYGPVGSFVAQPGVMNHVVLTRDAAGQMQVFHNGGLQFSLADTSNYGVAGAGPLRFFDDDGTESVPGFVDFIRIYDEALGANDVAAIYNNGTPNRFDSAPTTPGAVPEPATWAMMIGGFGLIGGALRRRTTVAA